MPHETDVDIRWHYLRYRTLVLLLLLVLAAIAGVIQLVRPDFWPRVTDRAQAQLDRLLSGETGNGGQNPPTTARAARFVNLEGDVEIKKVGTERFVPATLDTLLERGDTVQTQAQGYARIEFADQTAYLLNPSSLIVIEVNEFQTGRSRVAVDITSGLVDLSTAPSLPAGSTSSVKFADSNASLSGDSQAEVDTRQKSASLTMVTGAAQLVRGRDKITVSANERATVPPDGAIAVVTVPPVPHLLTPTNLTVIPEKPPAKVPVKFSWSPLASGSKYRLRISRVPFFTSLVSDQTTKDTTATLKDLPLGSYYWTVGQADSTTGQTEIAKFTLAKPNEKPPMVLSVDRITNIGTIVEITGHTDPGNTVYVDGKLVPLVGEDGTFKHVTSPYPGEGTYPITITAQDPSGRSITRKVEATIH